MSVITSTLAKLFIRITGIIKNDLNLKRLRREHNATGDTIVRIDVYEDRERRRLVFTKQYHVTDDGVLEVPETVEPNAISQIDYPTVVNLIHGTKTWTYQGKRYTEENYNYMRAFAEGRITVTKLRDVNGYMADMDLFEELYEQVLPRLKDTIGKYI